MKPISMRALQRFLRTAISALYIHGLISDTEYARARARFDKKFAKRPVSKGGR